MAHEGGIDAAGGFAAFADGPDYQGLASAGVACCEDVFAAGFVFDIRLDVVAFVEFEAEVFDDRVLLGVDEPQREP